MYEISITYKVKADYYLVTCPKKK